VPPSESRTGPRALETGKRLPLISAETGKSPFAQDCVVGLGEVSGFSRINDLLSGEGQIAPLIPNTARSGQRLDELSVGGCQLIAVVRRKKI
jgi:hypothetical protein